MLDFETLQTAIRTWAQVVSDMPVVWENDQRPFLGKIPVYVLLTEPDAVRSIGEDYTTYSQNDDPLPLTATQAGNREFSVMVKVIGRSQKGNRASRYYAEILKSSLKKPSIKEHFRANEIAIVRAGATNNFDAPFEGRFEPISVFELILACGLAENIDTPVDTIGSVELSSTLADAVEVLPVPPNLDDEVISEDP